MNYRKLELTQNNKFNEEFDMFLNQIAKWHNLAPKLWLSDHKISKEDIEETTRKF